VTTQPGPQAAALGQSYPEPVFASVRVEFADGTFREFCVRKPLRADVTMSTPFHRSPIEADLGGLPVELIAPVLPEVEVRLKAGLDRHHQVMTFDTRSARSAGTIGMMLRLLSEAFDLRETHGSDDQAEAADAWNEWERKTSAFLTGGR